jgi:hypothetical protein
VEWSGNPRKLEDAIDEKLVDNKRLFSSNMLRAIGQLGMQFHLTPVSSKTNDGLIAVNSILERMLMQGEKYTT